MNKKQKIQYLEADLQDLEMIKSEYPRGIKRVAEDRDECNDLIIEAQLKYFELTGRYYEMNGNNQ